MSLQAKTRHEESEVRSQESGVRSQESGVRSQESGVRSQKSEAWTVNILFLFLVLYSYFCILIQA